MKNLITTSKLQVTSVKEVAGFGKNLYPYKMAQTDYYPKAKALLVRGKLNGEDVSFFSPSVKVTKVESQVMSRTHMEENSWFTQIEEEVQVARGAKMFDGGKHPNWAMNMPCKIVPKINVGDELNITYKLKGTFNGTKTIKSVRIIE